MISLILLYIILLAACVAFAQESVKQQGEFVKLELFHVLVYDNNVSSRGFFSVSSDSKQAYDPQQNGIFDEENLELFRSLLKRNGLYKLKLQVIRFDNSTSHFVTSSIPSCELQKSGFKEDIVLHLDSRGGPIGVSYSSPVIALSRPCDPSKIKLPLYFHTRIKIQDPLIAQSVPLHATAPVPPHLKHLDMNSPSGSNNIEGTSGGSLGTGGQGKSQQPPQTFLQKYWYIVLMLAAYMLLGGSGQVKEEAAIASNTKKS